MSAPPQPSATSAAAAPPPPPAASASDQTGAVEDKPRDVRFIELLLSSQGIQDLDEQVIPLLLEFAHRYMADILQESLLYADHANRSNVNLDDIKLAIQSKTAHSFTSPPTRDLLQELAREKNAMPLPLIPDRPGLRLPPKQYTLTGATYEIVPKPLDPSNINAMPLPHSLTASPNKSALGPPPTALGHPALGHPVAPGSGSRSASPAVGGGAGASGSGDGASGSASGSASAPPHDETDEDGDGEDEDAMDVDQSGTA
ncbi:transcription initiation factor IID, 31kD subunit-domain-containing protein, partial [Catenaria anguillulae PL171]